MENITSSKLFTTRQGTVLLGVVAAVIAAIALLVYLNHYRNSVKNSNAAISVLVAQKLIQSGTPGDVIRTTAGFYKATSYAKSQVETGAILDPATLAGKVALTDISPGQQLTAADFGPSTGLTNSLNANQRAVVVALGSPQDVGGQIGAGSHVDVWIVLGENGTSGVSKPVVKLLYQDMYVLNSGTNGGNVTLRATPTQAGTLIYASSNAQIYLTLRPTIGTTPKPPVISAANLVGH
ncbi:MAG TPA: Flp pilus assembly protein CpaB [Gaiellaceae bacterium]|nr:Flp pilus assembly protein CpaB [Gaiellaceae bacterium]